MIVAYEEILIGRVLDGSNNAQHGNVPSAYQLSILALTGKRGKRAKLMLTETVMQGSALPAR